MARFFLASEAWPSGSCVAELKGDESKHLAHVLRLRPGAEVTVFDGQGRRAIGEVLGVARQGVQLRIGPPIHAARPRGRITLVQAIPKGKNMDWIVQKAVELGVARVIPVITRHTIVQPGEAKAVKWRRIALEACKQCGQDFLPVVDDPCAFTELIAREEFPGLRLIASLAAGAQPFASYLPLEQDQLDTTILIGPEGDFTSEETSQALEKGFLPVSLGEIVLRVETATLYSLSVLRHELEVAAFVQR